MIGTDEQDAINHLTVAFQKLLETHTFFGNDFFQSFCLQEFCI
jgi:hypothetical protein